MNVTVVKSHENGLLGRKEVDAEIGYEGATPKRAEIKTALGGKIGANPEFMVLYKVASKFGSRSVKISAHIYHTKEALLKTEPTYIKVREGLMEKPKKEKKVAAKKAPAKK